MSERRFIQPPDIVTVESPLIFIAGPIQGAPDWQSEAITRIHDTDPDITIATPRKDYPEGTFDYGRQVDWETHFLRESGGIGVIAFWLACQTVPTPGRAYAQTSRLELGEWKAKQEASPDDVFLTVGIEPGFGNERYIRRRFGQDCRYVQIADTLPELCSNAVKLLVRRRIAARVN